MHERRRKAARGALVLAALWCAPGAARAGVIPPTFRAASVSYGAPADFDCDQRADISRRVHNGRWQIDLSSNGFGHWDLAYQGYGGSMAILLPADYDGDCRADLSVKDDYGYWHIDYARDGFGAWNQSLPGYGPDASIPVPADYDGDSKVDLSVKDPYGYWYIDYASDGFGAWNEIHTGYGWAAAIPVPADYDGDGRADLSIKGDDGCWDIDYASDGFGYWNAIYCGYGNASALPVPADYDGDGKADLAVTGSSGGWFIDYAADGFGAWNNMYWDYVAPNVYGKNEPLPADYDGDRRADPALHSLDEFWYVDFSANGIGNAFPSFDLRDALDVPVYPKVELVARTQHSLKIKVSALGPDAQGRSSAEQVKVTANGYTSGEYGTLHWRELANLAAGTEYCFTSRAINSAGTQSRSDCFTTEAPPPPPPPPTQTGVSRIDVFNCGVEEHTVHLWIFDFTLGHWQELGTLASQYDNNGCPGSATPFIVTPTDGHNFRLVVVDPESDFCGGENDPLNGGCQKAELWGRGLASGPFYRFLIF